MNVAVTLRSIFTALLLVTGLFSAHTAIATQADKSEPTELVFLNWSEYLDPELITKFEEEFNVSLREIYFESDDGRDDLILETSATGYDLAMINGASMETYRQQGWLAPLDAANLKTYSYFDARWLDAFPGVRGHAVPYFWGTLGIAYRSDLVEPAPTSWMDLFRPVENVRGKIGMIDTARDILGMALKALGYSANSTDRKQVDEAAALLLEQKPFVKTYVSLSLEEESALVSGEVTMAMLFSGDALAIQEFHDDIEYLVPEEGGNLWCDYLVVMNSSKKKELARAFIDFLNRPENAAQLAQYVYYATPNTAAEKLLPEDFLADPVIYPSKEVLDKSEAYYPLPPRTERMRNSAYIRVFQDQ